MNGRIHYLGPEETFTQQAALSLKRRGGGTFELVPAKTLSQAILRTCEHDGDFAVLPYYNLHEGLVQETLDLITERQLTVRAAERIPVRFALGGFHGGSHKGAPARLPDPSETAEIFSHPKAIAQCSVYLHSFFPQAEYRELGSTASAVERVAETRSGFAIARCEAFEKRSVPILAENIGNRQYGRTNFTEFLLIGFPDRPGTTRFPFAATEPNRTMIAVIPTLDRVGLLADILGQVAFFGINLLKIHSRPALSDHKTEHDPQMFYLEMETRTDSREFRLCRDSLELRLSRSGPSGTEGVVRVLGEYPLFS
ncbi:MAG TPA: hypothetical protein DEB39_03225 [Planctomycetaceae bacterium]|nr:hypothetical protein [Planctomycetaceae bacterium]